MRPSPVSRQTHPVPQRTPTRAPRRAPQRIPSSSWRNHRSFDVLETRRMLSAAPPAQAPVPDGTWQVLGGRGADQIVLNVSPDDAATLRATIGGKVVATRAAASVTRIDVLAGAGDDEVTISLGASAGAIAVRVDGGRGRDRVAGGPAAGEPAGGPRPPR